MNPLAELFPPQQEIDSLFHQLTEPYAPSNAPPSLLSLVDDPDPHPADQQNALLSILAAGPSQAPAPPPQAPTLLEKLMKWAHPHAYSPFLYSPPTVIHSATSPRSSNNNNNNSSHRRNSNSSSHYRSHRNNRRLLLPANPCSNSSPPLTISLPP